MQLRDFREQPIIQKIGAYADYPFDALESALASQLYKTALKKTGPREKHLTSQVIPLLRLIECYLQISGQRLNQAILSSSTSITILREFIGALYSPGFIELSLSRRLEYVYTFNYLTNIASASGLAYPHPIVIASTLGATEEIASLTSLAEKRELDPDKVWLWRNWPSTSKAGRTTWHPLFYIYKKFGRAFTERFYRACDRYFSARRADKIDGLKQFCIFVDKYAEAAHEEELSDPQFTTQLLKDFCRYFFSEGHAAGWKMQTLFDQWGSFAETFVKGELIPSGLLNMPHEAVPTIPRKSSEGSSTHVVKTSAGYSVKTKLVTPIPLHVSDPVAIEMLFLQIRREFDILVTWAKTEIKDIWARRCRAVSLGSAGEVRQIQEKRYFKQISDESDCIGWTVSRANPDHLANAATTLNRNGYITNDDARIGLIFPLPLDQTAHELGLPKAQALLPHCTLLIAKHPEITPAFLETLELYDKNGKKVGVDISERGTLLVGFKRRRGPGRAQQVVILNEETALVVHQIIEITAPLRKYLRERGDDNWRFLLLTCKRAFGYPGRIQRLASDTSRSSCLKWLAQRLVLTTGINSSEAQLLAKQFSLPALRGQAGVLVYLESKNLNAMARALGHTTYDWRLVQHYLPEPILAYFQERWIRLFQTGIIIEAMKNSDFLLEASGFSTMDEIDQFLQHHVLRSIPASTEQVSFPPKPAQTDTGEIVFGLNVGVLTTLLSLIQAVERAKQVVNKRALFWAELGAQLVCHIESLQSNRPDLFGYLQDARDKATPDLMSQVIHA